VSDGVIRTVLRAESYSPICAWSGDRLRL